MMRKHTDLNKRILTDCDGCLLNWEYAFRLWISEHGYEPKYEGDGKYHYGLDKTYGVSEEEMMDLVITFNESAAIGFLPPLRDAMYYVKKMHEEHGYYFHAITSMGDDPHAAKLREMNLNKLFGDTTFEKIVCLPTASTKQNILGQYKADGYNGYWIEDKISNALEGAELGFKALLMEHGHNMNHPHDDYTIVKNWKHIYEIIVKNGE